MSNFWQRLITGTLFVSLLSFCIVYNKWSYFTLFSVITLLGQHEYLKLAGIKTTSMHAVINMLSGLLLFTGTFFYSAGMLERFSPELLWLLFVIPAFLLLKDDKGFAAKELVFSLIYVVLPFAMVNILVFSDVNLLGKSIYHGRLLMGFFILLWANDTFAYLSGRTFGKHKLFERVSPKKTWEGLIGGAVISMAFSQLMPFLFPDVLMPLQWAFFALIIAIFATLGDLGESALKRNLGIKDSGTILPGHGGILDRFDGLLGAMPWVVLCVKIC